MSLYFHPNRPISIGSDQELLLGRTSCDLFDDSDGEQDWEASEYRDEVPLGVPLLETIDEEDETQADIQDQRNDKKLNLLKRQPDPEDDGPTHYQAVAMEDPSITLAPGATYFSFGSIIVMFTQWRLRREIKVDMIAPQKFLPERGLTVTTDLESSASQRIQKARRKMGKVPSRYSLLT